MFKKKSTKIASAIDAVYEELEDHLESINSNTQEICENRAMIMELQERICKLSDHVQQLQSVLGSQVPARFEEPINLDAQEQECFLLLYTASAPLSYSNIARKMRLPVVSVQDIVFSLIQKQVPVLKQRLDGGDVWLTLDMEFRELQTKHNIVRIDRNVSKFYNNDFQMSLFD